MEHLNGLVQALVQFLGASVPGAIVWAVLMWTSRKVA